MIGCSRCGHPIMDKAGFCQSCYKQWKQWMRVREKMGGYREGTFVTAMPLPPRMLTTKEAKILTAFHELKTAVVEALDAACGVDRRNAPVEWERCSGNTSIWKDDESGASSGWDTIVRVFEDSR